MTAQLYAFKVKDYTTMLFGQKGQLSNGLDGYFVQRGDGKKYEYDKDRIEWFQFIGLYELPLENSEHSEF